jgi:hypothetical protein
MVIGDKCGWDAVNEFTKRDAPATIISDFESFIGMPVKTIVTVRSPYNNIGSWVQSPKYQRMYLDRDDLFYRMVKRYRRFYKSAWEILQGVDYFILPHERLVATPNDTLQRLSEWLELPTHKSWRRDTSSRIWKTPRAHNLEWPQKHRQAVADFISEHPLMEFYR